MDIKSFFVSFRNLLTGSLIWLLVLGGAFILLVDETALIASMSGGLSTTATTGSQATTNDTKFLPVAVEESETVESDAASGTQLEIAAAQPQEKIQDATEPSDAGSVVNVEKVETSPAQSAAIATSESTQPMQTAALSPPAVKGAPHTAADAGEGAWYIQIGVFSNAKNAEQLRALAKINGWDVAVHTVIDGAKLVTKLLIGPYDTKVAANGAVGEVAEDLKISDMYVTRAIL